MRINTTLTITLFLFAFSNSLFAKLLPLEISHLYKISNSVVTARVIAVEMLPDEDSPDNKSCGYIYHFKINEVMKGDVNVESFRSPDRLLVGLDYLIFFPSHDSSTKNQSPGPLFPESNESDFPHEIDCIKKYDTFVTIYPAFPPEIFEFDHDAAMRSHSDWIRVPYKFLAFPKNIPVVTVRTDPDQAYQKYFNEYGDYFDEYQIVRWKELEDYLKSLNK